jgi:hypothetical protein
MIGTNDDVTGHRADSLGRIWNQRPTIRLMMQMSEMARKGAGARLGTKWRSRTCNRSSEAQPTFVLRLLQQDPRDMDKEFDRVSVRVNLTN